jgi:hypothetical protein
MMRSLVGELERRRLPVVSFLAGLGEAVAEGLYFIVVLGHEETLIRLIDQVVEEIRSEWDLAHFGYANETSPFHKLLSGAPAKHDLKKDQAIALTRAGASRCCGDAATANSAYSAMRRSFSTCSEMVVT